MECDGFYTLESEGGQEIGGSRAGMGWDFGRFGLFVLNDGVIDGERVLPGDGSRRRRRRRSGCRMPVVEITHYGYSWWLARRDVGLAVRPAHRHLSQGRPCRGDLRRLPAADGTAGDTQANEWVAFHPLRSGPRFA